MHFRGKRMRFYADYPDGSSEELINIAKYNYNWQLSYTYEEPKFVPAGTKITAVAAWDNSARNPANPNPDRAVDWAAKTERAQTARLNRKFGNAHPATGGRFAVRSV